MFLRYSLLFTMLVLAADPCAWAQSPPTHHHSFGGAEHWSKVFDDPSRDAWQKPHEVIQALDLRPDSIVADIGAGTGYFSVRLAHFVPEGKVYGADVEPDMVGYLRSRAEREGLKNLTAVAAKADDPSLPEPVDVVLMVDVLHHIANRPAYLKRLGNSLKPQGRIAIIDFNQRSQMGPPKGERLTQSTVKSDMKKSGYVMLKEVKFLPDQYFLIFARGRQ